MKKRRLVVSALIIVSSLALSASSGQRQAKWQGTKEDVDGVTVIKNPKQPMYKEEVCTIKEDLSIGKAEGQEEYMFGYIPGLAVDDNGDIYVADVQAMQIRVFDQDGKFLRTIGRKGQGPGEFTGIQSIQITPNKELMLYDNVQHRLVYFSLAGQFIRSKHFSVSVGTMGRLNPHSPLYCDSRENYYIVTGIMEFPKASKAHQEILKIGGDLKFMTLVRTADHDPMGPFNVFGIAELYCQLMAKDYVLAGSSKDYELQIFDPQGKVIKKISRDYDPVPVSEVEKNEERKKRNSVTRWEFPRDHFPMSFLAADEEGRIFVRTWEKPAKGTGYFFDVYDPEGKYITRIPLSFSPRVLKKGNLYAIEADEAGFQYVKRYKLTWKF
jgi:hypothetical protein